MCKVGSLAGWRAQVLAAILVAGCSTAPPASNAATPSAVPQATPGRTTLPPTGQPSPTPEPTISGPHFTLVGLGDSVAGGLKCNDPCQSYVLTYGDLATTALGLPVVTHNLATNDGLESDTLLGRVRNETEYRSAIAGADIITLQVGGNDWQGPCNFENHTSCLLFGQKRVEPNLDAILTEIQALREGKPTAIRVVTSYNGYVGNKLTPSIWSFAARPEDIETFDKDFAQALHDFNAMTCRVAVAHGAICVDIGPVFNGPKLDQPAAEGLINSDGAHALEAGQNLIAKTLDSAGYAPLAN
jgi:lysophospholipase L1-like esterase